MGVFLDRHTETTLARSFALVGSAFHRTPYSCRRSCPWYPSRPIYVDVMVLQPTGHNGCSVFVVSPLRGCVRML